MPGFQRHDASVATKLLWRGMKNLKPSDSEVQNARRDGAGTHVDDDRHQDGCRVLAQQRELDLHDRHQKRLALAEGRKPLVVVCLPTEEEICFSPLTYLQPTGRKQVLEINGMRFTIVEVAPSN